MIEVAPSREVATDQAPYLLFDLGAFTGNDFCRAVTTSFRFQECAVATVNLGGQADGPTRAESGARVRSRDAARSLGAPVAMGAIVGAWTPAELDSVWPTARTDVARRIDSLSRRERQVVDGLTFGRTNKTIARELDISPRTVEVYRANAMTKLGAQTLSDLIRMTLVANSGAGAGRTAARAPSR